MLKNVSPFSLFPTFPSSSSAFSFALFSQSPLIPFSLPFPPSPFPDLRHIPIFILSSFFYFFLLPFFPFTSSFLPPTSSYFHSFIFFLHLLPLSSFSSSSSFVHYSISPFPPLSTVHLRFLPLLPFLSQLSPFFSPTLSSFSFSSFSLLSALPPSLLPHPFYILIVLLQTSTFFILFHLSLFSPVPSLLHILSSNTSTYSQRTFELKSGNIPLFKLSKINNKVE